MSTRRVVVISGGRGPEHEVSLASGAAIARGLADAGYEVVACRVSPDGTWHTGGRDGLGAALATLATADVVVPALHGPWGEDGTLQGFLETVGVPYVGSGVLASATCMDKVRTKERLAAAGVPVAGGRVVGARLAPDEDHALVMALGLPLFVKPVRSGSSYGVSRVTDVDGLAPAVAAAGAFDASVLVEPELRGREIDIAVLELPDGSLRTSPLLEIVADPREPFFTTAAKYASDRTRFLVPAPVDPSVAAGVAATARQAFRALGCAGLARVDGFVEASGAVVVNEVNTFPGFTEHSQVPRMWRAAGLPFPELVATLVETAAARSGAVRVAVPA